MTTRSEKGSLGGSRHLTFPNRPPQPNYKGLVGFPSMWLKLPPEHLRALRDRARYETAHWRVEHGGRGHVVTPPDIIRRLIAAYFADTSPLPDDQIGNSLRSGKGG